MTKEKVIDTLIYVFFYMQLEALEKQGIIKMTDMEKIDKINAEIMNTAYKYSCKLM